MKNKMRPIHPGEILGEEYLKPMNLSARALAQAIDVPSNRISDILRGRRNVTGDTALRLARYFRTTPEFWMNLQQAYELRIAEDEVGQSIKRIKPAAQVLEDRLSESQAS